MTATVAADSRPAARQAARDDDPRPTGPRPTRTAAGTGHRGEQEISDDLQGPCSDRTGWRPRLRTGSAGLLGGLAGASGIALTATSGWLIVSAAARPVILTLLTAIVAVRAFGIARPALRYAERLRSHDTALGALTRRRVALFAALIPLTPARLGRRRRADLLTGLVSDLDDEVDAQVRVAVPLVATAVGGLIAAAVCLVLLAPVGLAVTAMLAVAALVAATDYLLERRGQASVVAARARASATATLIADNITGLRAIGAEQAVTARLAQDHRALRRAVGRQSAGRATGVGLTVLLVAATTVVAAALAVDAWRAGVIGAPVAALLTLTPIALGEVLTALPDAVGALARSQAARRRVAELLSQQPAVAGQGTGELGEPGEPGEPGTAGHQVRPPELAVHGLTASWADAGSDPASVDLGPVELVVPPGEHLVLAGPNGSGKSTLLAVLARQLDPAGGSYLIDGRDATGLGLAAVRERIAVLDDEPYVFATTVRENLRLARPGCSDADLVDALTAAGLRPWLEGLPDGLDTLLGSPGSGRAAGPAGSEGSAGQGPVERGVSGGERTRLGLARVLLSERPIVLLDEPVAHLDHPTALAVLQTLTAALRDRTVVMVSHRADGRHLFDRVVTWD